MSQVDVSRVSLSQLINPTEKQKEAFAATLKHRFMLYGGAGGGGKSYFLRWWGIRELLRLFGSTKIRNIRIGLFSVDYPTLTDRQISRINAEIPAWLGRLRETRAEGYNFKLHERFGGGTIALRNLDDPSKYRSSEFAAIAVEELTENPKEAFDDLRFRLRWPGVPRPNFAAATNPGGPGHEWVKRLWIDGDFPDELKPLAHEFKFVRAFAQDNPHLSNQYYQDLLTLPEDKRKAYAEGDWDIFAGQYFSEWRDEVHVVEPFRIPAHWKVWLACDWGFEAPFVALWLAQSPDGELFVVHEVSGTRLRVKEQAQMIFSGNTHLGRGPEFCILDSACWDDSRGKSIAQQFQELGIDFRRSTKNRLGGWQKVRQLLAWEKDADGNLVSSPRLKVFRSCRGLIRTLPAQVHDKNRVEDIDTKGNDHWVDALRYGLMIEDVDVTTPLHIMHPDDAEAIIAAEKQQQLPYSIYGG
jgi:phage terminase large subunit